jgi:hypothetical protein
MPTCKLCNNSGLFLTVDNLGLCKKCSFIVNSEKDGIVKIVMESTDIVTKSKNISTIISRTDTIIEKLTDLLRYERMGIPIVDPNVNHYMKIAIHMKNAKLTELLLVYFKDAQQKSDKQKTLTVKLNTLNGILDKVNETIQLLDNNDDQIGPYLEEIETVRKDTANLIANAN